MRFTMYGTVSDVNDLAEHSADTAEMDPTTLSLCEAWISNGGPFSRAVNGRELFLQVLVADESAAVFVLTVDDELREHVLIVSGRDRDKDREAKQSFIDACRQAGWSVEHAARPMPPPTCYAVIMPRIGGPPIGEGDIQALLATTTYLAAAFYMRLGFPVP